MKRKEIQGKSPVSPFRFLNINFYISTRIPRIAEGTFRRASTLEDISIISSNNDKSKGFPWSLLINSQTMHVECEIFHKLCIAHFKNTKKKNKRKEPKEKNQKKRTKRK